MLADAVPVEDVRMRRDFQQILTVVRAHAFMHERTRKVDDKGRVVADRRDYEAAYRLLANVLAITLDSVTDETRQTVDVVTRLIASGSKSVTYRQLMSELGLSKSGVSLRAKQAVEAGFLVNTEQRRGYPARLELGEPLPEDRPVLPAPGDLFAADVPPNSTSQRPPEKPRQDGTETVERGG
jgi:hypothetical protein